MRAKQETIWNFMINKLILITILTEKGPQLSSILPSSSNMLMKGRL